MLNYPDISFDWLNEWPSKIDQDRALQTFDVLSDYSQLIQTYISGYEIDIENTLASFNQTAKEWATSTLHSGIEERTKEFERFFDLDIAFAKSERNRLTKIKNERNKHNLASHTYIDLAADHAKAKTNLLDVFFTFGLGVNKDAQLTPVFDNTKKDQIEGSYLIPLGNILISQSPIYIANHLLDHPIFLKWLKTFAREKCTNTGIGTCMCWTPTGRGLSAIMGSLAYLNFIHLCLDIQNSHPTKLLETTIKCIKKIDACFTILSSTFNVDIETAWKRQIEADSASRIASENARKGHKNKAERYKAAKLITTDIFNHYKESGLSNSDIADKVMEKYFTLKNTNQWRDFNARPKFETVRNNWIPKLRKGKSL